MFKKNKKNKKDINDLIDEFYLEIYNSYVDLTETIPDMTTEASIYTQAQVIAEEEFNQYEVKKEDKVKINIIVLVAILTFLLSLYTDIQYVNAKGTKQIEEALGDYHEELDFYAKEWGFKYDTNEVSQEIINHNDNIYYAFAHLYLMLKEQDEMGYKIFDEYEQKYTPEDYLQLIYIKVNNQLHFSNCYTYEEYLQLFQKNGDYGCLEENYNNYLNRIRKKGDKNGKQ